MSEAKGKGVDEKEAKKRKVRETKGREKRDRTVHGVDIAKDRV